MADATDSVTLVIITKDGRTHHFKPFGISMGGGAVHVLDRPAPEQLAPDIAVFPLVEIESLIVGPGGSEFGGTLEALP